MYGNILLFVSYFGTPKVFKPWNTKKYHQWNSRNVLVMYQTSVLCWRKKRSVEQCWFSYSFFSIQLVKNLEYLSYSSSSALFKIWRLTAPAMQRVVFIWHNLLSWVLTEHFSCVGSICHYSADNFSVLGESTSITSQIFLGFVKRNWITKLSEISFKTPILGNLRGYIICYSFLSKEQSVRL